MKDECYVYWIREMGHNDIFTEGYVGVTSNFDYRLKQHIYNSQNINQHKHYRTAFRNALSTGNYVATIILIGSREYCMEVEAKLRPEWKIGWNLAKGGCGGYGKHGLTGTKVRGVYYNALKRAKDEHLIFFEDWLGEGGLEKFADYWDSLPEGDVISLKDFDKGYIPGNLIKTSRSECFRKSSAVHDIGDGKLYSVIELSEKFNIRANTISTNLARGFTIKQSLGLDPKEKFVDFSYEKEMAVYYLWNSPMTHHQIGKLVGLDKSTLKRQLKDYQLPNWLFSHCEIVDRYRAVCRRIPRRRCFETGDDILDIEDAYIGGEAINSISKRIGVSHDAIEKLLLDLENAEYY